MNILSSPCAIHLRQEQPADYETVEQLTAAAFKNALHASGSETLLARKLRTAASFVPELDFVAEMNGRIVGSILYTRSKVIGNAQEWETLTFGPLSVLPEFQQKGIGSALIRHTLKLAQELGYRAVLIFGHEDYYPRFGFENAAKYNITTADGKNFPAFMALPLYENALTEVSGRLHYDPIYDCV